jgi:glyoxylase-like metal-dependent hydrolase (beta-lactamase superfamily II)
MRIVTVAGGPVMTNTFIVADDDGAALVIDPGFDPRGVDDLVRKRGWRVAAVVVTHGHFDHIAGCRAAKDLWAAPLAMHPDTAPIATAADDHAAWFGLSCENCPEPDRLLAHGETLAVGALAFEVRAIPGHCPGSIALVGGGHVFVGDALFAGSIGRVDLPHSDPLELMRSIRDQLMSLPDETVVHPGHGEDTTIGDERRHNPFRAEWERAE